MPFFCFVDNNKKAEKDMGTGLPVYSLDEYKDKYDIENTKFVI